MFTQRRHNPRTRILTPSRPPADRSADPAGCGCLTEAGSCATANVDARGGALGANAAAALTTFVHSWNPSLGHLIDQLYTPAWSAHEAQVHDERGGVRGFCCVALQFAGVAQGGGSIAGRAHQPALPLPLEQRNGWPKRSVRAR